MKKLLLYIALCFSLASNGYAQTSLDTLIDKNVPPASKSSTINKQLNPVLKAMVLASGGVANQVLAFGTVVAGDSTVVYNDITFRFGATTYSLLDGTATIDVPDDDTTARIDLLVANSDGSITVLEGDPGNLTVPAYDVNSQLPITVILQNIGGNGSNTVIPYATTEQMNAGTAGKLPDAEKVKAYVDAAIEEALASIVIPGGGGAGSGYVPLTGSDSLSGNHRYATGSTIDTKNTGDTLNIGTVRAGGIRLGTTGSEIKFGTAANLKFYNVDGSTMTIGRGVGFGSRIEMDATTGSVAMQPTGFTGANGGNTISLRMSNGLIIGNGSGTSSLSGTQLQIGNGSNALTLQPLTLSANRTLYFPNRNDTIVTRSDLVGLGGGGGEANLGANLGAGVGVYASKVGATLNFRSLIAGTNVALTNDANTITINVPDAVTLTGTQTLTNKTLTSPVINSPTGITKSDVGLANVDNTSDANKPISTATQSALNLKADSTYSYPKSSINTFLAGKVPTTRTVNGQSLSSNVTLSKSDVGLGNVDNTSDATKNSATATLTNKTISGANNTLSNIPESAVTNLVSDLAAKADATTVATNSAKLNYLAGPGNAGNLADIPTQVQLFAFGDSFTRGATASVIAKSYVSTISEALGTLANNQGNDGDGVFGCFKKVVQAEAASGNTFSATMMIGFNDIRRDNSAKGLEGVKGGHRAIFANHFLKTAVAANNAGVTTSGTWTTVTAGTYNDKASLSLSGLGRQSSVSGSTLTYSFTGSNIVIGTWGCDNVAFTDGGFSVTVDGIAVGSWSPSNKASAIHGRTQNAFMAFGLGGSTHTLVITTTSNNPTLIDYIGTLNVPSLCPAMLVGGLCKQTTAGYATVIGTYPLSNDANFDAADAVIKEAMGEFPGYPLYFVNPNKYLVPATDIQTSDNIHPNDLGMGHIAQSFIETVRQTPTLGILSVRSHVGPSILRAVNDVGTTTQLVNYLSTQGVSGFVGPSTGLVSSTSTNLHLGSSVASSSVGLFAGGFTSNDEKVVFNSAGNGIQSSNPGNTSLFYQVKNVNTGSTATAYVISQADSPLSFGALRAVNNAGVVTQITQYGNNFPTTGMLRLNDGLLTSSAPGSFHVGNQSATGKLTFFTGGTAAFSNIRGNVSLAGNWRLGDTTAAVGKLNVYQSSLGTAVTRWESAATTNNVLSTVFQNKVTTTDATVTTLHTFATATDVNYTLMVTITAKRTGGASGTAGDRANYIIAVPVANVAGTVTVGTPVSLLTVQPAWGGVTFPVSGTNVLIQVSGASANNVSWTLNKLEANEGNN